MMVIAHMADFSLSFVFNYLSLPVRTHSLLGRLANLFHLLNKFTAQWQHLFRLQTEYLIELVGGEKRNE